MTEPLSHRVTRRSDVNVPEWFFLSDEAAALSVQDKFIHIGSYGNVRRVIWGRTSTTGAQAVIKELRVIDEKAQMLADMSVTVRHPHVLNTYGSCRINNLFCLVYEDALRGNFSQYFSDGANADSLWKLFFQASTGLLFLETKNVAHGNLKCSNILVCADGKAKISDFGLERFRRDSSSSVRWLAPECLRGDVENVNFPSDVFAFGMCILEAWTGDVPWGKEATEEDITKAVCAGNIPSCPDDMSDRAWELIQKMCHPVPFHRPTMTEVSNELYGHMEVDTKARGVSFCDNCSSTISIGDSFCASCGFKTMLSELRKPEERITFDVNHEFAKREGMALATSLDDQDCSKCGFTVSCAHNFCESCGTKVLKLQQQASSSQREANESVIDVGEKYESLALVSGEATGQIILV